jgi:transcriptional regulator with XRE-family HTH domain
MVEKASNRDRAIQLRRDGLSRSQIAAALGLRSGGRALSEWLRDVPPPEWTKRPRAKDDLRAEAVVLRREGKSYREILEVVPVSKSTLSLWLREVVLTAEQHDHLMQLNRLGQTKAARTIQARRVARQRATIEAASAQVAEVAESELFVAGVVAYWAEGSKAKPWRQGEQVQFINSDPDMIRLFMRWLALLGVGCERLVFTVSIHESADVAAAERYWRSVVGHNAQFRKPVLKRHNAKTVRKNIADNYHGLPRRLCAPKHRVVPADRGMVDRYRRLTDRGSSNGRTQDSGSWNRRSTRRPRAELNPLPPLGLESG